MKILITLLLILFALIPFNDQITTNDRFTYWDDNCKEIKGPPPHKDHRVSGIISAIFDSPPVPIWAGGIKIALSTQRKIDEGVSRLLWRLKLLLYIFSLQMFLAECISTGNSFQLYFSFHTKTRGEGGGNNNKLLPKFPPTLSITLYFYCKLDAPPPSPSIEEICVFCHRTIWQKKQKPINSVLFPIFTTNREAALSLDLPRNNARILRPGVNRRNIDLWWKTELHHVNYIKLQ